MNDGGFHRVTGPYREKRWPFQVIAMCTCRRGTRCNSMADAREFMRSCVDAAAVQFRNADLQEGMR